MIKDNTPSLFINSPVRRSLQRLVQNETLWTAPIIAILFASLIRWIVALNPYSGKTHVHLVLTTDIEHIPRLQRTTHVWRLWSTASLDGDHHTPTYLQMVQIRFTVVGFGLSTFDSFPQLVVRYHVSSETVQDTFNYWSLPQWFKDRRVMVCARYIKRHRDWIKQAVYEIYSVCIRGSDLHARCACVLSNCVWI